MVAMVETSQPEATFADIRGSNRGVRQSRSVLCVGLSFHEALREIRTC